MTVVILQWLVRLVVPIVVPDATAFGVIGGLLVDWPSSRVVAVRRGGRYSVDQLGLTLIIRRDGLYNQTHER